MICKVSTYFEGIKSKQPTKKPKQKKPKANQASSVNTVEDTAMSRFLHSKESVRRRSNYRASDASINSDDAVHSVGFLDDDEEDISADATLPRDGA